MLMECMMVVVGGSDGGPMYLVQGTCSHFESVLAGDLKPVVCHPLTAPIDCCKRRRANACLRCGSSDDIGSCHCTVAA